MTSTPISTGFVAGEIFDKFVPVRDYYYKSGAIHQGNNYGPYRFNFDLWSAWVFKATPHNHNKANR